MNKAFVKDDDTWEEPEIELDPEADIPAGSRNYMTPQGAARLREELNDLVRQQRPQLLDSINRMGREGLDSADAKFREARKSLQRLEKRVAFLTGRLAITEVIDPAAQGSEHIRFGATVTVEPSSGPQKVYRIVGIDEADINQGRISWTSPLARALLNGKAGDVIKVSTPAGEQELEIIEVRYIDIENSS
jgi:transcription elongation factor GreB